MGRFYKMEVKVSGVLEPFIEPVIEAIKVRFDADEISQEAEGMMWGVMPSHIIRSTDHFDLMLSESEEEFAKELATAICKASETPVSVQVICTCLDEAPTVFYDFTSEELNGEG